MQNTRHLSWIPFKSSFFVCECLLFLACTHIYLVRLWIEEDERKSWKGLSALHGSTTQLNLLICPHPHPPPFKSFFSYTFCFFPLQCLTTHIAILLLCLARVASCVEGDDHGLTCDSINIFLCVKVVWNISKRYGGEKGGGRRENNI